MRFCSKQRHIPNSPLALKRDSGHNTDQPKHFQTWRCTVCNVWCVVGVANENPEKSEKFPKFQSFNRQKPCAFVPPLNRHFFEPTFQAFCRKSFCFSLLIFGWMSASMHALSHVHTIWTQQRLTESSPQRFCLARSNFNLSVLKIFLRWFSDLFSYFWDGVIMVLQATNANSVSRAWSGISKTRWKDVTEPRAYRLKSQLTIDWRNERKNDEKKTRKSLIETHANCKVAKSIQYLVIST